MTQKDNSSVRRTGDCRVKLSPEMLARLDQIAEHEYGMPTATLAAFAIAEWLKSKDAIRAQTTMGIMEAARKMGGTAGQMLEQLAQSPEYVDQCIALAQKNLPLDGEVAKGNEA